jgi:hypothetical protein
MKKRERRYHTGKKMQRTIINIFTENIREVIDGEIIRIMKVMASGETNIESDLIPFGNKK